MVRNTMLATMLGVALGATAVYAQDLMEEKMVRFEPSVQVIGLENGGLSVTKPGEMIPTPGVSYKAYPYGSIFEVGDGVKCRLRFSDLTYAVVKGPAKLTPIASDLFSKVVLDVARGDVNLSVDTRAQPGQFTVVTPMGSFTSLQGTSRLHVGDISNAEVDENDFSFRTLSGTAVFGGLHYKMGNMTQANAFFSGDATSVTSNGKIFRDTQIEGVSGEVVTELPMGAENKIDFSLTPGSVVKITRAKHPGSNNWVVSVLTLFANGVAQNYFCYVEGRGAEYATGDLVGEVLPEETEEELGEEGGEDDLFGDDESDDMGGGDSLDDFGDDFGDDEQF